MITPKERDMNRSRDVEGPKLIRPYEENNMKSYSSEESQTGTLQKCPLSELHQGDHEAPLAASGMQEVVVKASMGQDSPDHKPMVAKGATKDQSHSGK